MSRTLRRIALIVSSILALLVAAHFALSWWFRFKDWPEIVGPWPSGVKPFMEEGELTKRLQKRFPPGTPVSSLVGKLQRQGFGIYPGDRAHWEGGGFPSDYDVEVNWMASEGKLTAIHGHRQITSL